MTGAALRARRPPAILLTFILAAIAFGAAAVLLAAPTVAPPPVSNSPSGGFTLGDAATLSEILLLALIVIPLVLFIIHRFRGGTTLIPSRQLTVALVILLLLTAFVFFVHYAPGAFYCPTSTCNGSVPPTTGGSGSGSNGSNLSLQPGGAFGFTFPGWVLWVVVLAIGATVALVVLPIALARTPASSRSQRSTSELRADLASAIAELSVATAGTPRERVIQVYARWLGRVTRGAGDLSRLTAREIEAICVERLGIRTSTAHTLTTLFEEARYSAHPIGEEIVVRAQAALNEALQDFDRRHVATAGMAS